MLACFPNFLDACRVGSRLAKAWLNEEQARFIGRFITYHRDRVKAYSLHDRLIVYPVLEGVEILLQRLFLGVDKPITSGDKALSRELAKIEAGGE